MRALLDVNVLLALFDPMHVHHEAAHEWFARNRESGWATCPLTENGFVRVVSNPSYPGQGTSLRDAVDRLEEFRRSGGHEFWPDSFSICDRDPLRPAHLQGHRQLVDAYLLGLAVGNGGRLATFDRALPLRAVAGAAPRHLAILGG